MKTLAAVALLSIVACGDSTGPESIPLYDGFVLERVNAERIPVQISGDASLVGGGVRCPSSSDGFPAQEVYNFLIYHPYNVEEVTVSFEVVCEVQPPNRIRYTYPATGETIIGTFSEGAGAEKGRFIQQKRLPSRESFTATVGWISTIPPAAPDCVFRQYK